MKEIKTIAIKCDTKDVLGLAEMTELQGNLKHREDIDFDKIKLSIIKFGFSFPFFVWRGDGKNYILDGHGRFSTLCKMQKDGYLVPPLPVVYIEADNKAQAKEKLLRLNSTYGKMTAESVIEFVDGDFELNTMEIALPDTTINFVSGDDFESEFPELASGDKTTMSTMTFTLSADQVQTVKEALKKVGRVEAEDNQNNNGNALACICREFLTNG